MKAAKILPYEKVQIANVTTGERLETYVIEGKAGSGVICLNGAAALKGNVGDIIIIIAYALIEKDEAALFKPSFVKVDKNNHIA
jgi:aspartate 1-decarboxylase